LEQADIVVKINQNFGCSPDYCYGNGYSLMRKLYNLIVRTNRPRCTQVLLARFLHNARIARQVEYDTRANEPCSSVVLLLLGASFGRWRQAVTSTQEGGGRR